MLSNVIHHLLGRLLPVGGGCGARAPPGSHVQLAAQQYGVGAVEDEVVGGQLNQFARLGSAGHANDDWVRREELSR